ncbi:hypothetical protein AWN76_009925 [Rhodothermaceae bacterium RA]|nr:hypothetical protein AWN76_009925 [Rhodothermaceae bacterium RA]
MARTKSPASPSPEPERPEEALPESDPGSNVDKIRDILFGSQMRDYEQRFVRLEERLLKESRELRDEMKRRFDALETYVRQEVETQTKHLREERRERTEAIDELTDEVRGTRTALERRLGRLQEEWTQSESALRQTILDQAKAMTDDLQQQNAALTEALERAVAELRERKTDRAALAGLLQEMALRLTDELHLPGSD